MINIMVWSIRLLNKKFQLDIFVIRCCTVVPKIKNSPTRTDRRLYQINYAIYITIFQKSLTNHFLVNFHNSLAKLRSLLIAYKKAKPLFEKEAFKVF